MSIAKNFSCVVVASGKEDIVISDGEIFNLKGGDTVMSRVTGMGCMSSAIIGAFLAVADPLDSALCAVSLMNHCGKKSADNASGPGSFRGNFLDSLYNY